MAELTPAQRRRNVQKVRDAAAELREMENALADVMARAPALLAKVTRIRETIEGALAPPKKEDEDEHTE